MGKGEMIKAEIIIAAEITREAAIIEIGVKNAGLIFRSNLKVLTNKSKLLLTNAFNEILFWECILIGGCISLF